MNLKATRFFSICIFLVFAFAICFFGISVYKNIVTGKTLATEIFSTITSDAVDYINFYGVTENFSQKFTEYVQNKNEIAGLIIMQDSSSCFAYPVSSSIIQFDNFGEPIIKGNSPIFTIFSSTLPVDNYVGINITTAVYLIQPSKIFSIAKISFFDNVPFSISQNPKATQITSVQTIVVELATVVCFNDSNHNTK